MSSLFPNTDHTRRDIAHHFRKSMGAVTETALLDLLAASPSRWDAYYAVLALRDVGTERAIPALKALLSFPMQDVKDCALLTIAHIAGATETPFYVHALEMKGFRKVYPMWAIEVAADDRAVSAVCAYLLAALRKAGRPKPADPGDAYVSGFKYFARLGFDQLTRCQDRLAPTLRKAWPALPEGHRRALASLLPSSWLTLT